MNTGTPTANYMLQTNLTLASAPSPGKQCKRHFPITFKRGLKLWRLVPYMATRKQNLFKLATVPTPDFGTLRSGQRSVRLHGQRQHYHFLTFQRHRRRAAPCLPASGEEENARRSQEILLAAEPNLHGFREGRASIEMSCVAAAVRALGVGRQDWGTFRRGRCIPSFRPPPEG